LKYLIMGYIILYILTRTVKKYSNYFEYVLLFYLKKEPYFYFFCLNNISKNEMKYSNSPKKTNPSLKSNSNKNKSKFFSLFIWYFFTALLLK